MVVPDYKNVQYINAPVSWLGTTTLTAELAKDGTLAKATAAVEPKIAEGIAQLLPLKEFLTAELIPDTGEDVIEDKAASGIVLKITVKGALYSFRARHRKDPRKKSRRG